MTTMTWSMPERRARQVAQAAGSFEHLLLGRAPTSVGIVADADWMVVHIHESFSPAERRIACEAEGARRVRDFHRYLFENSLDSLICQIRRATGVELRGAVAHVDVSSGSVLKMLTTRSDVDLFLLGEGVPALGVPVNAHLHAIQPHINGSSVADGTFAVRGRTPGGSRNHEEGDPCWC